ncbi:MAG: tetratricopeptide repeat protein [Desulfobulbaceae bacterium]|jgi:tetratricopeptide (TPR) repeat protein|nr:tetratricopeptide repeat protein [Desulfobulbaceae bacterium]
MNDCCPYFKRLISALLCVSFFMLAPPAFAGDRQDDISPAARVALVKAQTLIGDKQYGQAIALLQAYQKGGKSDRLEIENMIGICYLLENKPKQAAKTLEKALALDPHHVPARLNLAKAAFDDQDYPKASKNFAEAYAVDGEKNPEHLYFAAISALQAGDGARAAALLERLQQKTGGAFKMEWREALTQALVNENRVREALPHMLALTKSMSGDKKKQWQEVLLHQYSRLGMEKEAVAMVSELLETEPREGKWWRALVHIHLERNDYPAALAALHILGFIAPLSGQERVLEADLFLQTGIPGQAAPLYTKILAEGGGNDALNKAIIARQQNGQPQEALTLLERYAPKPLSAELSLKKADLLYQAGQYQDAARQYQTAANSGCKEKKRALQMADYMKSLALAYSVH